MTKLDVIKETTKNRLDYIDGLTGMSLGTLKTLLRIFEIRIGELEIYIEELKKGEAENYERECLDEDNGYAIPDPEDYYD